MVAFLSGCCSLGSTSVLQRIQTSPVRGSVRGVEGNGQENGERVGKLLKVNMSWKVVCVYVCVYRLTGGGD